MPRVVKLIAVALGFAVVTFALGLALFYSRPEPTKPWGGMDRGVRPFPKVSSETNEPSERSDK